MVATPLAVNNLLYILVILTTDQNAEKSGQAFVGACIKMFVVANCLGGVIETGGIQVEMPFNSNSVFHTKNHT